MKVAAIIPARYASSRFPGKPLVDILGKPMIQRVYERVAQVSGISRVVVATDDPRIYDAVAGFGGQARMTRDDHPSGTDRLAEVAADLDDDLVVNVQGDEPLIDPRMVESALAPLRQNSSIPMGTLKTPLQSAEEFLNPNVVKVVTDQEGFALYFSRAPIPHPRDFSNNPPAEFPRMVAFKHVGLYVYRRDFLLEFPRLQPTPLEELEKLEQLRALEHGIRIHVAFTDLVSTGVDTPADLEKVRAFLQQS